jgi:hypothetical protein
VTDPTGTYGFAVARPERSRRDNMGRLIGTTTQYTFLPGKQYSNTGQPLAIRCDNGPELTSRHFLAWCVERKIELLHIQP